MKKIIGLLLFLIVGGTFLTIVVFTIEASADTSPAGDLGSLLVKTSPQLQESAFPVSQISCPASPAAEEIEGVTIICGTITVPENYDDPDGNQVDLVFAVLKSDSLAPAADPVIYLHGGPGSAELRSLRQMSERFAPIRQTRDVIIFDQRGTGYSNNRLTCEVEYATQQEALREAIQEREGGSGYIDEESALNLALFAVCLDRFEEIGTDITQYNTINNAQDVVNLASALDYDEFNLYGFSYGTQLALEVMRRHPQKLRSVILDSVAPADIKLYENMGQPNVEAMTALFEICANDDECDAAYPDLKNRFISLLDQLDEQPLQDEGGSPITSENLVGALRQSDIQPGLGAYLPLLIWDLEQGNLDVLNAIANNELPPPLPAVVDPRSLRYAGLDLAQDTELLIDTAFDLRQQARDLETTAARLLERGDEQILGNIVEDSLAARFDFVFHEIMNKEPFDRRLALNQAYLTLPLKGTDRLTVQEFVATNFQGIDRDRLMALANSMSNDDVQDLAEIIFGKARDYAYLFDVSLALSLYACQEHIPYNTLEGAVDTFAELEIPKLAYRSGKLRTVENLMHTCALFPTGSEPEEFHDPVASDIPALILLGTADTQTAISWGEHVANNLENGRSVLFPETGHGAIRYSQCARDIGAAFFNNPEGEINTACTEDLLPIFELPPER